jgi:ATP-dependent DNA ligase
MFWKGKDLRSLSLIERRKYLQHFDKDPEKIWIRSTGCQEQVTHAAQ